MVGNGVGRETAKKNGSFRGCQVVVCAGRVGPPAVDNLLQLKNTYWNVRQTSAQEGE